MIYMLINNSSEDLDEAVHNGWHLTRIHSGVYVHMKYKADGCLSFPFLQCHYSCHNLFSSC